MAEGTATRIELASLQAIFARKGNYEVFEEDRREKVWLIGSQSLQSSLDIRTAQSGSTGHDAMLYLLSTASFSSLNPIAQFLRVNATIKASQDRSPFN